MQPLTFYSHKQGPNPWKSVLIFEELNIPYETHFLDFGAGAKGVEGEEFKQKNPAGRVPLIYDPATGVSLAESNAIAQYLVEFYDKESRLTFTTMPEKYLVNQWLNFQGASQGPLFQQAFISKFVKNDPEGLAHFQGLVKRTLGTVDQALEGKQYLVGDKCTIADLAFVNWDLSLASFMAGDEEAGTEELRAKKFPNWAAWHKRLLERAAVQKMMQIQQKANAA
ncbi:hypothetical protein H2200_009323 [Cladophialophora chaetospira]|uniref:Glutathione S-transferase n=1 Tax=Cladophialophora chaetospira TaxID=386627 RepID=A0AA38X3W6_9EURO|nr:hypothetical protein H2200_009323 [Cladophialophora chaetospira]